jgi:hypothetical protein
MRFTEIVENTVTEAPMNPTVFAQSIQTGHDKGVQVGFEFEVCIPKATITAWKTGGSEPTPGGYDPNSTEWINGKTVADLLAGFERYGQRSWKENMNDLFKNKTSVARDIGSNSVWEAYSSWANKKVAEFRAAQQNPMIPKLKELLNDPKLDEPFGDHNSRRYETDSPEYSLTLKGVLLSRIKEKSGIDLTSGFDEDALKEKMTEVREAINSMYYSTNRPVDQLFYNVINAGDVAVQRYMSTLFPSSRYSNSDDDREEQLRSNVTNFTDFCNEVYGTDELKKLLLNKWAFRGRVNNATPILKEKLWFFITPGSEPPESLAPRRRYQSNDSYSEGANMLKAKLTPSFGDNITVFRGYHQETKKLDRWYIEPDGSLRPNSGDSSAEVVSPPLRARDAMEALKTFYQQAQAMKLYTNNSTGLHINVSIPDQLDVLKLAMFVGDQHVLQKFGRENNSYARSLLNNLRGNTSVRVQKSEDFPQAEQDLSSIAKRYSGDHFATCNFNGKYVSFRHAGGDYLSKLGDIVDTVGRFIRAMVIASDPKMYRDEYIKKLTAMVSKNNPPADTSRDKLKQGIPALNMDFMMGDVTNAKANIKQFLDNKFGGIPYVVVHDEMTSQRLLNTNGLATTTRERIVAGGSEVCLRVMLYPISATQLNTITNNIQRINGDRGTPFGIYQGGVGYGAGGGEKVSVGVLWAGKLTRKDKGFTQAYQALGGGSSGGRLPLPEQAR